MMMLMLMPQNPDERSCCRADRGLLDLLMVKINVIAEKEEREKREAYKNVDG
jgi:hypothetical protein